MVHQKPSVPVDWRVSVCNERIGTGSCEKNTNVRLWCETYRSDVSACAEQERVHSTRMSLQELCHIVDLANAR